MFPYGQILMTGDGPGSLHCTLKGTGIYGLEFYAGQTLAQRLGLLLAMFIQMNAWDSTGQFMALGPLVFTVPDK